MIHPQEGAVTLRRTARMDAVSEMDLTGLQQRTGEAVF